MAVAGGVAVYHFGAAWLEGRTRARVQSHLEQRDYLRAQLTLEQAVQVSPHSLTARRALAEFYEAANSPIAVGRWREAAALAPGDDEIALKFASAALRLEGPAEGREALAQVSTTGKSTLAYHRVAAGVALAEGKADELQQHLEAMAALEPDNTRTKLTLASLRLRSRDPAVESAARAELEQIARGENLRIHATLSLLAVLPQGNDGPGARELASRILPPGSWKIGTPVTFPLVDHMKAEPHPSAEDAAALADWMVSRGLAREALVWLSTQENSVQNASLVLAARAGAAIQLRDWRLLRQLIAEGAWGRLSGEPLELAFAARVQRERATVANAKETFADAIELASPSLPTLKALNRLCAIWGWPDESERVLTRIVRDFPREQSAWMELLARAATADKSARYWELVHRRAQLFPGDATAQALRTYAAVVTGQSDAEARKAAQSALTRPEALAEELAAGLLLRSREKSAADALGLLSARQVELLSRSQKGSLVYGSLLAAAGKDASAILERVSRSHLLPEERALLPKTGAPVAAPLGRN
ncbi:MAG TPA: hypothetical protein VHO24_13075 [Opitutaceae bacterium]|nr:hypothetical protein [Opitutaceae bacterium]